MVAAAATDPAAIVDRGRNLTGQLLAELEATTAHIDAIEGAIHAATASDESPARRQMMEKAVSLPTRAMALKNLAQAFKTLGETSASGRAGGKKAQARDAARDAAAGGGRFATPQAPRMVVNNTAPKP